MDYGSGDLAFAEIKNQIRLKAGDFVTFDEVPIESFDGRQAGFVLNQLARVPSDSLFFVNVAPRKEYSLDRDNKGEDLLYVELKNANKIITTNSLYLLTYLKDEIVSIHSLKVSDDKSQFRSRDFFSYVAGKFVSSMNRHQVHFEKLREHFIDDENLFETQKNTLRCLREEIGYEELSKGKIALRSLYVDSFGNIKTTIRRSHFLQLGIDLNKKQTVNLKDRDGNLLAANVLFNESLFSVDEGNYTIYFGSSGFDDQFLEIALRSGNAYEALNKLKYYVLEF